MFLENLVIVAEIRFWLFTRRGSWGKNANWSLRLDIISKDLVEIGDIHGLDSFKCFLGRLIAILVYLSGVISKEGIGLHSGEKQGL